MFIFKKAHHTVNYCRFNEIQLFYFIGTVNAAQLFEINPLILHTIPIIPKIYHKEMTFSLIVSIS